MKLYYDDALQAAWMAKEFAVKIVGYESYDNDFDWSCFFSVDCGFNIEERNEHFEVRSDNYEIFKPQIGDLVLDFSTCGYGDEDWQENAATYAKNHGQPRCVVSQEDWQVKYKGRQWTYPSNAESKWGGKIIQRNNKAFFMPKVLND